MGSDDDDDDDATTIRLNATLVTATLRQQCNSVPEWLDDPVYLDPAASYTWRCCRCSCTRCTTDCRG
jgi:hypothetical protein